jgi:tetratricopeptide (TPR) repeat protein
MGLCPMPIDLSEAIEQHRRGELELAASSYQAALAEDPDRHEALHYLGLLALQQGDARSAAALVARAVAIRPEVASYHATVGEAYWALGQPSRAIASYRESLRLFPDNAEALSNLGSMLKAEGNINEAIACLLRAVALRPDLAAAHNNLGSALQQHGDLTAAARHFRAAVRLDASIAEAHSNLGLVLLEQGDPEEAVGYSNEAVRLRPEFVAARLNLGNVLQALGRLGEADECFRAAIRLQPTSAAAHAGLAGVLDELGDLKGSVASLREAQRCNPRHTGALARLATRLGDHLPRDDQATIERLLADPSVPPAGRWPMQFGLAQVCDARGEFGRAAALATLANALQYDDFQRRRLAYDPSAHERFVDGLLAAFSLQFFAKVRGWGLETERPVFVVGMPRSGTTLVEQILSSHPRVFGAGELQLARNAFRAIPQITGRGGLPHESLGQLDPDAFAVLARRHIDALADRNESADRVVDKMPENTLYLGLLAALFPGAKFIHCRRDLRDSALSCWMTNFGQVRWACDQHHIASRAAAYRRVMDHWRRVLPVPVLEVDYESIVRDVESVSRQLVAWCALDWDAACLAFDKNPRPVRTASAAQVRRRIYSSSVGRWKNYENPLAPLFAELEKIT